MKLTTIIFKSLPVLFFFLLPSFVFGQTFEASDWVKAKVKVKEHWYEKKGVPMKNYYWNDSEMNRLLSDFEGQRFRRKAFLIPGSIGFGVGGLMYGTAISQPKCDEMGGVGVRCEGAIYRDLFLYFGGINATIGLGLSGVGLHQKVKSDKTLVRIMERYSELGL